MATVDSQIKYVLEWLNEFSEMQKSSFVNVLREVSENIWGEKERGEPQQPNGLSNGQDDNERLQATTRQVNGLSLNDSGVEVNGNEIDEKPKPDSLYEIRIRFFREWVPQWPRDVQRRVLYSLKDIDESFKISDENDRDINGNDDIVAVNNVDAVNDDAVVVVVVEPVAEPVAVEQQLVEN